VKIPTTNPPPRGRAGLKPADSENSVSDQDLRQTL
jgi:hypothetical protein